MIKPKKKVVFKPTDEQVGEGAYYYLQEIKGYNQAIDECETWRKEDKIKSIKKELVVWKRLQLEFKVAVCDCGERWDETDAAVLVDDHIEKLSKLLIKLKKG